MQKKGQEKTAGKTGKYIGWAIRRLVLVLFDVLAVNLSYFLALVIRFYVNNEFRAIAQEVYLPAFAQFTPWYTAISVVVFICFRLYSGRWKHAGLHDLNTIFAANVVTAVVHIVGTLAFVTRMPLTYYFIGALLQFFLIAGSRFAYSFFVLERSRFLSRNRAKVNVMIVGAGETARILRRQIENDSNNVARPVCIFSYKGKHAHELMNGLPVVNDLSKMGEYIAKYQVKCVILADSIMPMEIRERIRTACAQNKVEVQDFSGYLTNMGPGITPALLLRYVGGPVSLVIDGRGTVYENGEKAMMELHGNYSVEKLYAEDDTLVVVLTSPTIVLNDVHKDWVRDTEEETGKEISFF